MFHPAGSAQHRLTAESIPPGRGRFLGAEQLRLYLKNRSRSRLTGTLLGYFFGRQLGGGGGRVLSDINSLPLISETIHYHEMCYAAAHYHDIIMKCVHPNVDILILTDIFCGGKNNCFFAVAKRHVWPPPLWMGGRQLPAPPSPASAATACDVAFSLHQMPSFNCHPWL